MTIDYVLKYVEAIRRHAVALDDGRAHAREDDLYEAVLRAIANGDPNSQALAQAALKTKELKFSRWCG